MTEPNDRNLSTSSMVSNPMRLAQEIQLSVLNEQTKSSKPTSSQFININDLAHWFQKYGANSDILLQNNVETFIDHNGIRRYVDTWKIYHDPTANLHTYKGVKDLYIKTGCIHRKINCQLIEEKNYSHNEDSTLQSDQPEAIPKDTQFKETYPKETLANQESETILTSEIISTHFLNDWQKLWSYFEQDQEDELAKQAPFFRMFVEFYFHRYTAQCMVGLCLYNIFTYIVMVILYPELGVFLILYRNLSVLINLGTYLTCACLFKGSISNLFSDNSIKKPLDSTTNQSSSSPSPIQYRSLLHWKSNLKQLLLTSFYECSMIGYELLGLSTKTSTIETKKTLSYYDLMNISLKFLVRHNHINMQTINFNRITYRLILLFTTLIFPFYLFFNNYADIYYKDLPTNCNHGISNPYCEYLLIYLCLSFGIFTYFIQVLIFGSSVLVSLIGLAYGGEISYRLTNTWIRKFGCLRRIKPDKLCSIVPMEGLHGNVLKKSMKDSKDNTKESKELSELQKVIRQALAKNQQDDDDDDDNDDDDKEDNDNDPNQQENTRPQINSQENIFKWSEIDKTLLNENITNLLSQDATETYLFIKNFLLQADKIWSPMISGLFFLNLYVILTTVIYYFLYGIKNSEMIQIRIMIVAVVRTLIFVIYPIMSISHANSYISELKHMFINSSEYDFQLIGNRSKWLEFIESCPIVWTYYGIWITWDRLSGVLWTSSAGIIAFIVSLIHN